MRGFVVAFSAAEFALVERSERSLRAGGLTVDAPVLGERALSETLRKAGEPVLLLQAGAWLMSETLRVIPPSGIGLPLVAYGRTRD